MKTYDEVIDKMGDVSRHSYLGGALSEYESVNGAFWMVGFIYGKTESEVFSDVKASFMNKLHKR